MRVFIQEIISSMGIILCESRWRLQTLLHFKPSSFNNAGQILKLVGLSKGWLILWCSRDVHLYKKNITVKPLAGLQQLALKVVVTLMWNMVAYCFIDPKLDKHIPSFHCTIRFHYKTSQDFCLQSSSCRIEHWLWNICNTSSCITMLPTTFSLLCGLSFTVKNII